jgi:hypothetical protein
VRVHAPIATKDFTATEPLIETVRSAILSGITGSGG